MKLVFILLLAATSILQAQNTISFEEGMTSPEATLTNIAWLTGHWKGEAFGGVTEEIWSPPAGGTMMFSFRLIADGVINFYEFGHILEKEGTLILQLKHFGGNLMGWEEKDKTVDFRLIKVENNKLYFDDFSIERISDQEINMYVVISEADDSENEVQFNYHRQ
ncbi:DUF6265 family protein [Maribacter sp. ACAM166]|uniref:DUF6265 family protein n=1 Tax=Maribacter sp. ACAM166 TaxID=2508996 RepID=UPI0010FF4B1D|nr:DUF6265 family protein [Maribacter sp. ACAM166]TLP76982.1 hypothetical protein ES765_13910 [Maribacter sp. ACAM166]